MLNDVEPRRLISDSVKQIKNSLPVEKPSPIQPPPARVRANTRPSNAFNSRNASSSVHDVPPDLEDPLAGLTEPEKAELANRNTLDFEDLLNEMSNLESGSRTDALASMNWLDDEVSSASTPSKPTAQPLRQSRIDKFERSDHSDQRTQKDQRDQREKDDPPASHVPTTEVDLPPDATLPAVEAAETETSRITKPTEPEEALQNPSTPPKKPYDRDSKVDAMASTAWLHDEFEEFDTSSIRTKSTAQANQGRALWCGTQWTNLSFQARKLGLPELPYFDPKTMLLSKEVNNKLWKRLLRLYDFLGAEKAMLATPKMLNGGEVEWYSFLGEDKGIKAEIYD